MSNENILDEAVKAASGGGGFAVVLLAGRWLLNWLTGRFDKAQARLEAHAAEIDARWKAYTLRMEQRCQAAEDEAAKCHEDKLALSERLAALEGLGKGFGPVGQDHRPARSQALRALEARIAALEASRT